MLRRESQLWMSLVVLVAFGCERSSDSPAIQARALQANEAADRADRPSTSAFGQPPQTTTGADIQAAFDAGARLVHLDGEVAVDAPIVVPSGARLVGAARLVATATMTAVLDVSGTERVTIVGLTIDGADLANGILAADSRALMLERVELVHGRPNGLFAYGATDLSLRDVRAIDCWNDGVAIRGRGDGLFVSGGEYRGNGRDPNANGNGIDLNPGGKRARIIGAAFAENDGAGLVIEGGPNAIVEGWVETDVHVAAIDSRNNTGAGLEVVRKGVGPYPHRVSVVGGTFADNDREGLYLLGHGVVVSGAIVTGNGRHGVLIPKGARDVDIGPVYVGGNGTPGASWAGVYVDGQRVSVWARLVRGASDFVLGDADLEGTGSQPFGVRLGPNARAVRTMGETAVW